MGVHGMDHFEKLEKMALRLAPLEHPGITDERYCKLLEEGEKEGDLVKIYEFIEALERGGLNFPPKEMYDCLMAAWEKDKSRTIEILNKRTRVIDCVFFVYSMTGSRNLSLWTAFP